MRIESIHYRADGAEMIGYLAVDDRLPGPRPGVLVAPEGGGLQPQTRSIALRLAEAGYAAFAMDYYGDGLVLTEVEPVMARVNAFMAEPSGLRARAAAALAVLAGQPETDPGRLAAIGYCFGGTTVLELARAGADLKAVVGFHCGLGTVRPQDAPNIKASVLVCIGDGDPLVTPEQRLNFEREMAAGGVDWRINVYGGAGHSFTTPDAASLGIPGFGYHGPSDRRSWRAMIDTFDEAFGA
jgi:dienelactone hydrolase